MKYPAASMAYTMKMPLMLEAFSMTVLQVNRYSKMLMEASRDVLFMIDATWAVRDGMIARKACGSTMDHRIPKK